MKRTTGIILLCVAAIVLGFVMPVSAAPADLAAPAWHIVQRGETLSSIGRMYSVSPWSIASANHLANSNRIYVGQRLYIPNQPGESRTRGCGSTYVVRSGDTLYSISRTYGISPWSIATANGISNLGKIYVGQRLYLPCNIS
jgi:LysM repeat protein